MGQYTERHARSGVRARLPALECFPNQYPRYEVTLEIPEFTSVCPRTDLPDFGKVVVRYMPKRWCVELKSLKFYINGFRDVGIFQENAVNRILDDFVKAVKPEWVVVTGEFAARGGIKTIVEARHPRRASGKGR
ncbi:MAG: NADPH-dependent 7-cyano-7-deazaguanine reductase QueF [Candidatus Omnitrophica bacterium CG11_big_fil_rev_8_21_14_0_20_64_10]|nr:MAG: NADPH-dependent 7-cyano-7-deazaguanine reductase QueF [Candidatus Omnitrophica bacterium CG11_big_fil_rev_8_21_14_0_20_64_10]